MSETILGLLRAKEIVGQLIERADTFPRANTFGEGWLLALEEVVYKIDWELHYQRGRKLRESEVCAAFARTGEQQAGDTTPTYPY